MISPIGSEESVLEDEAYLLFYMKRVKKTAEIEPQKATKTETSPSVVAKAKLSAVLEPANQGSTDSEGTGNGGSHASTATSLSAEK